MKIIKCTIEYGHRELDQDDSEQNPFVVEASDSFEISFMRKMFLKGTINKLTLGDEFKFQGSMTFERLFKKLSEQIKKG